MKRYLIKKILIYLDFSKMFDSVSTSKALKQNENMLVDSEIRCETGIFEDNTKPGRLI